MIANYLFDLINPRTRALFAQKTRALLFLWAFKPLFERGDVDGRSSA